MKKENEEENYEEEKKENVEEEIKLGNEDDDDVPVLVFHTRTFHTGPFSNAIPEIS